MTYTLGGPTDRTQEGIRQALIAHGYGSLWEHNWFDYTSCPSGRDDWPWLMPVLKEGDDMTAEQWKLLQDTHHHTHILIPQLIMVLEQNNRGRRDEILKAIAAIGTGGGGIKRGDTVNIKGLLS